MAAWIEAEKLEKEGWSKIATTKLSRFALEKINESNESF